MPKAYNGQDLSEWSHLVDVDEIESGPRSFSFEADERQRIDLARRLGIVSIERAGAVVTLQQIGGGTIHAIGTISADLTQSCVVTLGPVEAHIKDEFEGWFSDKGRAVSFAKARSEREARKGHVEAELVEESVDPEPIVNGRVDIGELATQFLSLALDPYPRADGVSGSVLAVPPGQSADEGAALRKNPFEALKDWKERR